MWDLQANTMSRAIALEQYMADPKNYVARHGGTRAWRRNRATGTFGAKAFRDGRR